ncbi:MAG: polysaccharide deacetylase family protein [Gammaproteobacteria bacterium]
MKNKLATLSFDNGPTEKVTSYVYDVLAEYEVPAYFCVIGTQLKQPGHAALAAQALSLGHRLVNHSMTHTVPLGDNVNAEHAHAEITEMDHLMRDVIGDWGETWFRPFGREGNLGRHIFSRAALEQFRELKYSVMLWNSVPRDWVNPQTWVEAAMKDIEVNEHSLIVLHDIDSGAMRNLPNFLDQLIQKDVIFTLDLPVDCVPIRDGVVVAPDLIASLVAN